METNSVPHILQITPFPTRIPRHGGQIRASQIAKMLEIDGFSVKSIAIYHGDMYPDEVPTINLAESESGEPFHGSWPVKDFSYGKLLSLDNKLYNKLVDIVLSEKPNLILLEEPWLGEGVLRLKKEGLFSGKLIFSSYNIEHVAKKLILEEADVRERMAIVAEIEALEKVLCQHSDGCAAVTGSDAVVLRNLSAKDVVVAQNGAIRRDLSPLINILPQSVPPSTRYALFVASAHAPNISGFMDLVIDTLPKLRSHERIVIAGGVGEHIQRRLPQCKYPYMARDKVVITGIVSDYSLSCLFANASVVLLPILYGGGSNLKTAEALVAGLPIVATNQAFRGYEKFEGHDLAIIANDAASFGLAVRAQLDRAGGGIDGQPKFDELIWNSTLTPIAELARRVAQD